MAKVLPVVLAVWLAIAVFVLHHVAPVPFDIRAVKLI